MDSAESNSLNEQYCQIVKQVMSKMVFNAALEFRYRI
jgi:hypothetical protein